MLQQTQVRAALPFYERWMHRFPNVRALAAAGEDEVLHAFQGLGYYSRARSLLRAAREVVARFDGELPSSAEALRSLPGIGAYTAGAVASIAFGEAVPVVDGNVTRVLCRLFFLRGDPAKAPLKHALWERAAALVPRLRPGDFNQALMELGATLCTPRAPHCTECPLERRCEARRTGQAESLPEIPERSRVTPVSMAAAVVFHTGRVAIVQVGPEAARSAGMWQFPTVELEPHESDEAGARRAARELLGLGVRVQTPLAVLTHSVTRFRIRLAAYRCLRNSSPARKLPGNIRWRRVSELDAHAMPSAHRKLAQTLAHEPKP